MENNYKKYLKILSSIFLVTVVFVITLNVVVDPYGFFRLVDIEGFNRDKPDANKNNVAVNIIGLNKIKPNTLVLGTSRAAIGIDPTHKLIKEPYGRSFNFSMGAASIEEIYLTAKYIHQSSPLKKVVIGLDMLSFNAYRGVRKNLSPEALVVDNVFLNKHTVKALFSITAFKSSLRTLRKQGHPKNMTISPYGNMYYNGDYVKAKKGNRKMFNSTERDYITQNWYPMPVGKFAFVNDKRDSYKIFAQLLDFARAENIELYFYTSPIHVRLQKLMELDGLYDGFEDWKRRLVALSENSNFAYNNSSKGSSYNGQQFEIMDFAYYNSITSEPVPALGDRENIMKYYYEDSHFPSRLGDKVIERLFGGELLSDLLVDDTGSELAPTGAVTPFGVFLTSENIENHLKASRDKLKAFETSNPTDIKELTETHSKYRRTAEGN